jgi:hypothetical protein
VSVGHAMHGAGIGAIQGFVVSAFIAGGEIYGDTTELGYPALQKGGQDKKLIGARFPTPRLVAPDRTSWRSATRLGARGWPAFRRRWLTTRCSAG